MTIVNNGDAIPGQTKTFNSYNQPSVNTDGLVVFRARGKGPGEPPHGIYLRDMSVEGSAIVKVVDRTTLVPPPNNRDSTFIEFPSFPRIDRESDVFAFRGNSQPVYQYDDLEAVGTTGVFSDPGGVLVTGAAKLGTTPGFEFYAVPGVEPPLPFDVFPGAPAVTGTIIVFKGNYTEGTAAKTGAYYRELKPVDAGGSAPVELLANNTDTVIPGSNPPMVFGSISPPSAADGHAVFAGFDNEDAPTLGGIYRTPLSPKPPLQTLVSIGGPVPDGRGAPTGETFNRLGEGVSYDGRFVGFWGAWGTTTRPVTVHCPTSGNAGRRAFCLEQCPEPAGCTFQVPVHQGIFVHDTFAGRTHEIVATGDWYLDFLFWNFSGKVPGQEGEDEGEPARWRSSSFVAVDRGVGALFRAAFKAETTAGTQTIDLVTGPGTPLLTPVTLVDTTMDGAVLDPEAKGLLITGLGLERDGLRGGQLAIAAAMGSEEAGWAGLYLGRLSPGTGRGR